jgi:hypothetical protein
MWREFLRTLIAFLIIAGTLVGVAFGIDIFASWVSHLGLPEKTVFFLFGAAAGMYAKDIGRLLATFTEAVWQKLLKIM